MLITRTSPFSGKILTMALPITEEQMEKYHQGVYIQHAFPNLTPAQREFIKTGITEEEWNKAFGV